MFWVPVIFLCTVQGDCAFIYGDGYTTKNQCDQALAKALKVIKNDNMYRLSDGACLDIAPPKV